MKLKLKPKKCEFFKTRISFLGHIVSRDGIECDPKKIEAIKIWKRPTTVHDVRSFLGFTNYYHKFIHRYAQTAQPLNKLISGDNASKKHKKVDWDNKCEETFLNLKESCCKPPILAYADYIKPLKLHTDASGLGLGAILYQTQEDGTERVIAYASRTLSKTEKNYPAYKLEFLALKWSICDRFHEYLHGGSFEVLTDNNPLTYILTTAKLDATGQRWVANLANYNFSIKYKSGKLNVDADALSRNPWDVQIDTTIVQSIINYEALTPNTLFKSHGPNTNLLHSELVIVKGGYINNLIPQELEVKDSKVMTREKWIEAQKQDATINQVITLLNSKTLGHRKHHKNDSAEMKSMLRIKNQLILRKGLLYRKIKKGNWEGSILEFVVPTKYRKQVLRACHDDVGHAGIWKCTRLLRNQFYWANVNYDMEQHIKRCDRCIRFKAKTEVAPLESIEASYPMELVHIDYLTIESNKSERDVNILVVTDHYTRLAQAFVMSTQTAATVAKTLWDKYFMYYGIPEKILSDQGRNFESSLIMELCKLTGIKKLRITPYRPQTNGQCEKYNSTLINMIGMLPSEIKYNWQDHVNMLVHAYNCMDSTATKFSLYYLMFGREPNLPIDIEFGVKIPDLVATSTRNYVEKLWRRLAWAFKKAQEINLKERKRNKWNYNRKVRCSKIEKGDKVLVRQKAFKGKHKIQDKWEEDVYIVISQPIHNCPVFKVQNERSGKTKILHRNMLFPLSQELQCEDVNQKDRIPGPIKNKEETEDNSMVNTWESEDDINDEDINIEQEYNRPVTRARAKEKLKAQELNTSSVLNGNGTISILIQETTL